MYSLRDQGDHYSLKMNGQPWGGFPLFQLDSVSSRCKTSRLFAAKKTCSWENVAKIVSTLFLFLQSWSLSLIFPLGTEVYCTWYLRFSGTNWNLPGASSTRSPYSANWKKNLGCLFLSTKSRELVIGIRYCIQYIILSCFLYLWAISFFQTMISFFKIEV